MLRCFSSLGCPDLSLDATVRWLRVFDGGRLAHDAEVAAAGSTLQWWADLRRERDWQVEVMVETWWPAFLFA
jgi:hypothetical protein